MMLVATNNTTGQQQLGKTPIVLLNTSCLPAGSACIKDYNTSNNNETNNFAIMSSSLDVSTPTSTAIVSPISNNNANGNNLQCNSTNNNGGQKYETSYGGNVTSPSNSDGNNSQNLDDSTGNNKNKSKNSNGVNLTSMDSTSRGERDSLSNISSNSLIRQQSSASTNSCSVQFNESSPNNGDSSSNSSNTSHINNDSKANEENKLNNQTSKNTTINKEEERDKSNSSSSTTISASGNATTNTSLPNLTSINSLKAGLPTNIAKDEKDLIKKEETALSPPNMSPVGFGSIVGTQINECIENTGSAANKSNDSSLSCDKRMNLAGNVCNENDESSVNQPSGGHVVPGTGTNLNLISNCNSMSTNSNQLNSKSSLDGFCSDTSTSTSSTCNIPLNTSFIINNLSNSNGPPQVGSGGGVTNIISGGGSGINNCMEYMQQQNHIFVFSTQLANKGADAVLAGHFPTIIAYHCTQPATKSFFEDFFLKNPMKMTKLQRQNTLNIMGGLPPSGGAGSGGQLPWLSGGCNSIGKMSHKLALNKSETITAASSNSTGAGVLNENDMMCWDQTRSVMNSPTGDSSNAMKILESSESSGNSSKSVCTIISNDESGGIPSLQGVKVPDENLTPQQRQHREEQLAKLKKMNQFLFPENGGNDFHPQPGGNNQMMAGKLQVPPEVLAGAMPGNTVALMNMQTNMGNKHNAAAMRTISGNLMNHTKSIASNSQLDNIPNLGEDIIMPADIIGGSGCGPNDMSVNSSSLKQGCMTNMNNSGVLGPSSARTLMNASGANLNMMNNSAPIGMVSGGLMNDPSNAMIGNNSDVLSPFNSNHCLSSTQEGGGGGIMGSHKNMNAPPPHPSDMNSAVGMSQIEWSKLHHHLYEERLKNNHNNNNMPSEISCGGSTGCQQTLTRCNSTGFGGGGSMSHRTNSNTNANSRGNQGPPPPYHPTQRSASVPIATQSPNPSSPNNPTSNMSLPSPRTSNTMGGVLSSTTSPSMDVPSASSASVSNSNSSAATNTVAGGSISGGNGSTNKNTFSQQQGSPTTGSGAGSSNRNRSTINNLNTNPTTPLSHVSPKDIDTKNINATPTPDHKSMRPNSQRSRSPLLNDVPNNNAMEPRFPSPGLNFAASGATGANNQNLANSFKNQNSSLERQNLQQMPPQFCRRTDNMPLNPNSNRSNQTKMSNSFDPISSLAQMSQQLTGGVGLNSGGVGNSSNNMSALMGGPGSINDINMNGLMGGPMMGGPVDSAIEHCNQNPNGVGGNMGMSGIGGGAGSVVGPFGPGNCNMMGGNNGPICQRLLNPKMCGPNMSSGFNPNQVSGLGMRDGPSGFPGMMPTHRMLNHRMSANFGNFNISPNIQVKASTPNTIQYMPVRPQNNNGNNNMRVPPSLEFLQRYANPQIMGNSGGGPGSGSLASPSEMPAMNVPSDLNKMPNTNNNMGVNPNAMNQMNFFGNCNQIATMGNMGQPAGSSDQDELQGGGMMPNHDPMNIPGPHAPMLRGMRPMRQSGLQSGIGMNPGSRMQHPGMGNIPPNGLGNNAFSSNDNESIDCSDPTNSMFNNPAVTGLYQIKSNKPPPMGMSHGPPNLNPNNSSNVSLPNNNVINDQNPSSNPLQGSVMMGSNNSLLNNNMPNSNNGGAGGPLSGPGSMGYKPFVGPTSKDLKYAQQYHSFQQQLYATSTRNQQPGGGQQQPPNAMSPHSNPNAGFFVNK